MHYYAQLNENDICVGIASSSNPINQSNMIYIGFDDQDKVYRQYKNGIWSEEKYPDGFVKTPVQHLEDKLIKLYQECQKEIYGAFNFEGRTFSCDVTAQKDLDDFVWGFEKDPKFEGMPWWTLGGTELVFMEGAKAPLMKMAVLNVKIQAYAEYNRLDTILKSIDLKAPNAIELINNVQWRVG